MIIPTLLMAGTKAQRVISRITVPSPSGPGQRPVPRDEECDGD